MMDDKKTSQKFSDIPLSIDFIDFCRAELFALSENHEDMMMDSIDQRYCLSSHYRSVLSIFGSDIVAFLRRKTREYGGRWAGLMNISKSIGRYGTPGQSPIQTSDLPPNRLTSGGMYI